MELVVVVLVAAAGCFLILIIEQLAILYNMHLLHVQYFITLAKRANASVIRRRRGNFWGGGAGVSRIQSAVSS